MAKERISKVTTRSGDSGKTKLATGKTILKSGPMVSLVGAVDELNSHVGLALAQLAADPELQQRQDCMQGLTACQQALFDMGAVLAMEGAFEAPELGPLEVATETLNERLPPLTEFVRPAGNLASAQLHICRTVCRRAESRFWALIDSLAATPNGVSAASLPASYADCARYLNRLSDYFFVLARSVNDETEDQWRGPDS